MDDELFKRLKADLEKSGMGSEMVARQTFHQREWSANGGAGFLDRDEGKSREIDISATRVEQHYAGQTPCIHTEFKILADVKKSEKPWVVFKHYPVPALRMCAWNNLIDCIHLPGKPSAFTRVLSENSLVKICG